MIVLSAQHFYGCLGPAASVNQNVLFCQLLEEYKISRIERTQPSVKDADMEWVYERGWGSKQLSSGDWRFHHEAHKWSTSLMVRNT